MDTPPLKLVLITSGFDHLTARFHELPQRPCAIVELDHWSRPLRLKYALRRGLRLLFRRQLADCELYCRKHGLRYHRAHCNDVNGLRAILADSGAHLGITYNCPLIPMRALEPLSHGGINLHDALLPDYRGGSPLFWQVLHGESHTGCTVHYLSAQMDGGDILEQVKMRRPRHLHHRDLAHRINVEQGFPALTRAVEAIAAGSARPRPQRATGEERRAPNCDWRHWRELLGGRRLSPEHERDIECFVGRRAHRTIGAPRI